MIARSHRLDNFRFLLMFFVVFGHCLELFNTGLLYRVIYSFHMPAFVFLTGYFAKPHPNRIYSTLWIYVIFQTLYQLFDSYSLNALHSLSLQYTTPYWLLWYVLSMFFFLLILLYFQTQNRARQFCILFVSFIISLLCGYDSTIGYYLSLSRTLVFLPFFLLGYMCKHEPAARSAIEGTSSLPLRLCVAFFSFCAVVFSVFYLKRYSSITASMAYGSYSYQSLGYDASLRLKLFIIALFWIILLIAAIPNVHFPLITDIGKNTYPIFLLHGFLLRLFKQYGVFRFSFQMNIILAIVLSALVLVVLSRFTPIHFKHQRPSSSGQS